ncbi:TlpA disulfide reductase family protein [Tepidimonas aquatica]|uniref:Sporulation thiol-disulfide oxidoreductase A n=1 Tax=Tepidimonas aquatica TaxID=247482 RepID=A0A554WHN7_9BURK|nr:TlpA disulfide reductase family protein [Tepidimonas aquatica]TSE23084.1 Sporulation thiol-disulfide oxidoreductase A [Tepidimonas aquatica]
MSGTRRGWMVGVGALAALAGVGVAAWRLRLEPAADAAAAAFWAGRWPTPAGGEVRAEALRGGSLLLNFWATWCPPCVEELPLLQRFYDERRADGWRVLALAIDQPSSVRAFLQRMPLTLPVGLAGLGGTELAKQLGNATGALPFSVVFDAAGRVHARKLGQVKEDDLRTWATALGSG